MAFFQKKRGGRNDTDIYSYQLVESRGVNGNSHQRVLVNLDAYSSVDMALKRWPYDIGVFIRAGYLERADELNRRLERLRKLRAEGKA